MAKMTYAEIKAIVASYVAAAKQAGTWSNSSNNLPGLLDKIAKTVTIDGIFTDKLPQLDGEELPFGKTVEEYYQDLVAAIAYDDYKSSDTTAANDAMKPYYPEYEDASYNYTIGRKVFPTTVKYNEYERAVQSEGEFIEITSMILKRLYDSFGVFKFAAKKQIIANFITKIIATADASTATAYVDATTDITKGTRYKQGSPAVVCICKKSHTHASGDTFAKLISGGYLVPVTMVNELAKPVDTSTGEAFIEKVKKDVASAQFVTEGNSLNGNTVGAENGLILFVNKDVKPVLDVQVLAGAFNPDRLALPAEIVEVDDFGNDTNNVYAVLVDRRAMRLHPTYFAVREQLNGVGDYMNYFLHTENTAFISKNAFVKIYKPGA